MKKAFNKVFSYNKVFIPLFCTIMALELTEVILTVSRQFHNIHWLMFYFGIVFIGLMIALFILNMKKKLLACKWIASILIFLEAISAFACSFFSYPKVPTSSFAPFVIYIIYSCIMVAMLIAMFVLHTNMNETRNNQTVFALQIINCLFVIFTLICSITTIVLLAKNGYSYTMLLDLFSYLSCGAIVTFITFMESQNLGTYNKQLQTKK